MINGKYVDQDGMLHFNSPEEIEVKLLKMPSGNSHISCLLNYGALRALIHKKQVAIKSPLEINALVHSSQIAKIVVKLP